MAVQRRQLAEILGQRQRTVASIPKDTHAVVEVQLHNRCETGNHDGRSRRDVAI